MNDAFEILDVQHHPGEEQLVKATVVFNFDDEMPNGNVSQHIAITVRLSVSEGQSIAALHEAIYQKALDQIPRVLSATEGKSAKQLRSSVAESQDRGRAELAQWQTGGS
ncbi:hypothetical protein [Nitratireductor alexandrii]|uniref:hypothetical protein n=1 Tax=Nitratireductor alexandrii TaxID=2448161 RepID=UPI000FD7EC6B|nr:hypothetical protein [Nitratireductor alexandrii]